MIGNGDEDHYEEEERRGGDRVVYIEGKKKIQQKGDNVFFVLYFAQH